MVVGPGIAHHTDCLNWQQHGEGLPDVIIETSVADLIEINRIRLPQDIQLLARDISGNTNGKAGARERMPANERLRQAEFLAKLTDLILEQLAQWLDQLEVHPFR